MTTIICPLDAPIYRYFKLEHFESALQNKELVLVNPTKWNDPYELITQEIWVDDGRGNIKGRIRSCLDRCFCQCWSITEQSDTLLQAYSRVEWNDESSNRNVYRKLEGVQVRTTPRKLINVIDDRSGQRESFLGLVRYGSEDRIKGYVDSLLIRDEEALMSSHGIAEVLLLKREAFSHEGEMRLICIERDRSGETISIPFDPNYLFESIAFDPRLWTQERNERVEFARAGGYKGKVIDTGSYHPKSWIISRPQRA